MLFQEATANTNGYMIAGYAVAFIVMALYVASLYIRSRNLNRDLTTLEEMDKPAPKAAQPKPAKTAKPVTKKARK
jgi:hypothetical protein